MVPAHAPFILRVGGNHGPEAKDGQHEDHSGYVSHSSLLEI